MKINIINNSKIHHLFMNFNKTNFETLDMFVEMMD